MTRNYTRIMWTERTKGRPGAVASLRLCGRGAWVGGTQRSQTTRAVHWEAAIRPHCLNPAFVVPVGGAGLQ